ncbi:MAG: hypothetical protein ABIO70_35915 [Pseudomonadota bacterium]
MLRHRLDRLRSFLGLPPRTRPPLTEEDKVPVKGEGRLRDPGHDPSTMRAPCGRPGPAAEAGEEEQP